MGGRYSQGYQLFQSLTVKAFMAIRPHTDQIVDTVQLMLDTGLPSFKGEGTIRRLRDRFAPGVNERQAADFMMSIIKNAHENVRSTAYDEFQRVCFALRFTDSSDSCCTAPKRYTLQVGLRSVLISSETVASRLLEHMIPLCVHLYYTGFRLSTHGQVRRVE
jgi:hypothetical protein